MYRKLLISTGVLCLGIMNLYASAALPFYEITSAMLTQESTRNMTGVQFVQTMLQPGGPCITCSTCIWHYIKHEDGQFKSYCGENGLSDQGTVRLFSNEAGTELYALMHKSDSGGSYYWADHSVYTRQAQGRLVCADLCDALRAQSAKSFLACIDKQIPYGSRLVMRKRLYANGFKEPLSVQYTVQEDENRVHSIELIKKTPLSHRLRPVPLLAASGFSALLTFYAYRHKQYGFCVVSSLMGAVCVYQACSRRINTGAIAESSPSGYEE